MSEARKRTARAFVYGLGLGVLAMAFTMTVLAPDSGLSLAELPAPSMQFEDMDKRCWAFDTNHRDAGPNPGVWVCSNGQAMCNSSGVQLPTERVLNHAE